MAVVATGILRKMTGCTTASVAITATVGATGFFTRATRSRAFWPQSFMHIAGVSWCPPRQLGARGRYLEPPARFVKCWRPGRAQAGRIVNIIEPPVLTAETHRRRVLAICATAEEGIPYRLLRLRLLRFPCHHLCLTSLHPLSVEELFSWS